MEDPLLTIIVLAITWQWGDWRHWKDYYSTILFWALGNFIYLYLTINKPLWKFTYSVIFNLFMFPLLRIHYIKPQWAWLISLVAGVMIMIVFKIPLN